MGNFTNLAMHPGDFTLCQQEIGVILEITDEVLKSYSIYPTIGTFILDGQMKKQSTECAVRFDLPEGGCTIADDSIKNALRPRTKSRYKTDGRKRHFGWMPCGIYKDWDLEVLVLNTNHGRFLASFCVDGAKTVADQEAVLVGIATAIGRLNLSDTALQESVEYVQEQTKYFQADTIELVNSLFDSCELPCLKTWREWHGPDTEETMPFFE